MYQPLKQTRLYEQIAAQIRRQIVTGEVLPGHQLPTERDLAAQFQVSRTVVREALKSLTQERLIEVRPGRGTFVVDQSSEAVRDSLRTLVAIDHTNKFADVIEIREILEPHIAALAAERATDKQRQELTALAREMQSSYSDLDAFLEADHRFHMLLATASGNGVIPVLIGSIVELIQEHRRILRRHHLALPLTEDNGARLALVRHLEIIDAVLARDAPSARAAMVRHLAEVRTDNSQFNL